MFIRAGVLATSLCGAFGTKLLVVNASNVVGGNKTGHLLEVDLETKATRTVATGLEAQLEWIRTSVVCGDKWYSLPVEFPVGAYLATVDLSTGTYEGTQALSFLPFGLKCGDQDGELLTVSGTGSPPQFKLVKLNVSDASTTVIGEFPDVLWGGWLSIFHFSENELQASFPVKSKSQESAKGGEIFRMDLKTGEITFHKQVKACRGCPAVPYHLQHLGGDAAGHGVFATQEGIDELSFCQVDYSGSTVKVSHCKKDEDRYWWGMGRQPVQCDGDKLNYWASMGGLSSGYEPIFGADMDTGDLTDAVHLEGPYDDEQPEYLIGSMACSARETLLV